MSNDTGTIDITNLVGFLRQGFIDWGTNYIYGLEVAAPGFEWVALPVISSIDREIVKEILTVLANAAEMEAFFMTTAVRKASQAQDFITAVVAKNNLPSSATDAEYAAAEQEQMKAFKNFVKVTN